MTWRRDPQVATFLEGVHALNVHNAVDAGQEIRHLNHPFWELSEIEGASGIQEDWGLQQSLVPFYGDWHDLLCVDMASSPPSVVLLNDERVVLYRWPNRQAFEASLRTLDDEPSKESSVVEEDSWLDF